MAARPEKRSPALNVSTSVGRGLAPAVFQGYLLCSARFPGCAAPSANGWPRGPPQRRKTESERWFGKARRGCGTAPDAIFHKVRPQWAGRGLDQPLRFCAPERFYPAQGVTPVMGGTGGKPSLANEVRLCGVPRRSFGYFPIVGKVPRRPQAAKSLRFTETKNQ